MKSIAIAARKGGTGKTTLAAHLAVAASAKQRVVLVDVDPQRSLTEWHEERQADTPELVTVSVHKLREELETVSDEDGLLVIDTPPQDSAAIGAVIAVADLVVIPVRPSASDIRAVHVTRELAERAGKPYLFVLTQANSRAANVAQALEVLRTYGPVAKTVMYMRVDYSDSMTDGQVAAEIAPNGLAAEEVIVLWKQISSILGKQKDSTLARA